MTPRRLLICGSRTWTNVECIRGILATQPEGSIIIHGKNGYDADGKALSADDDDALAVRGADCLAGAEGARLGFTVLPFPADWEMHGRAAGPIRNDRMLKEGKPTHCLAFTNNLAASRGTRDMVSKCVAAGVPTRIISETDVQDARELV